MNLSNHKNNQVTIRVLQLICPTGFYGAERWILALASQLSQHNVVCDLAVTSEVQSQDIEILNRFPRTNGSVFRVEMSNRFDIRVVGKIIKLVRSNNINIIHTHGYKSDLLGLFVSKICRISCVSTPHGFGEIIDKKLRAYIAVGNFALRFIDKVVPLSTGLYDDLVRRGVPDRKLLVIENGVDLTEIDEVNSNNDPISCVDQLTIAYVGRLVSGKRVDHIVRCFNSLYQTNKNLNLVIAGDGEAMNSLVQLAKSLPCGSAITFTGYVENRFSLMRNIDVFMMTSESEGIPRCVMEALALRVPVVAYAIPGVTELVVNEKTGLLVKSGDIVELTQALERLLADRDLRECLGNAGRTLIEERFSAQRLAEQYVDLYRNLLKDVY